MQCQSFNLFFLNKVALSCLSFHFDLDSPKDAKKVKSVRPTDGLKCEIWATRVEFGPQGWDLGLRGGDLGLKAKIRVEGRGTDVEGEGENSPYL